MELSRSLFHLEIGPYAVPVIILLHPDDAPALARDPTPILLELQYHVLAHAAPLLLPHPPAPPPLAAGPVSCTGPLLRVELTAAAPRAFYSVGGRRVAGFEVTARVSLRAGAQARTLAALGFAGGGGAGRE